MNATAPSDELKDDDVINIMRENFAELEIAGEFPTQAEIEAMCVAQLQKICPSAIPYALEAYKGTNECAFMWHEAFKHVANMLQYTLENPLATQSGERKDDVEISDALKI